MAEAKQYSLALQRVPRFELHIGFILLYLAGILLTIGMKYPLLQLPGPIKTTFGLPCLACGSSRCIAALLQFDLLSAFKYNPAILLIIFICILQVGLAVLQVTAGLRFNVQMPAIAIRNFKTVLLCLLFANYLYLLLNHI